MTSVLTNCCPTAFFLLLLFFPLNDIKSQHELVEATGDILLVALPATALGTTLIIGDKKGTWQFTKGFLLNQMMTMGLKEIINKPRPFNNGYKAFPSGHTSTTFQAASFIHKRYGIKYGIPAYLLAGFTGFSRINAKRHDGWDVLAGGAIGVLSSYLFTTANGSEKIELGFNSSVNNYVISFRYTF